MSKKSVRIVFPGVAQKPDTVIEDHVPECKLKNGLQNNYQKKVNGNSYFEEILREKRTQEYNREVKDALKRRKLWKSFQKELEKDIKCALVKISGPAWWQEPSRKQITLASSLGDVIKADEEEGVTGRTRQWLLDLGVVTRITPKQVRACMKRSLMNPVDFLLEVHDCVVHIQQNEKKKRGHLERPCSVDERLLLSAVCVLQLPTLLTMLHYILPSAEPLPKSTYVQELLYGDLSDESIRYATPYMEPLPFRNQDDFKAWAFDRVYKALLPSVIKSISKDNINESAAVRGMSISPMTPQLLEHILPSITSYKRKLSEISSIPSVVLLMSHYVSNRERSLSVLTTPGKHSIDRSEISRKSFSRNLAKKIKYSVQLQKQEIVTDEPQDIHDIENITDSSISSELEDQVDVDNEDDLSLNEPIVMLPKLKLNSGSKQTNNQFEGTYVDSQLNEDQDTYSTDVTKKLDKSKDSLLTKLGLQSIWDEVKEVPKEKQLKYAISVLAKLGDPLAQLPNVHKLPTIQRWLEIRKGKKRILTKVEKEKLLSLSRGMWKRNVTGGMKEIPKIKCSKRKERLLTWDKKRWLTCEVSKELESYYSRVRTEKVDNARAFFPSMLNHYDHCSRLNRDFRDVYFTYLPSREADLEVFRPWKPNETMGSRNK